MKALGFLFTALVLAALLGVPAVQALEPHDRSGWYFGLGFGPIRGAILIEGDDSWYWDTGSSPQIRLGKVLGQHFGFGLESQTWFTEIGTAGEDVPLQIKFRVTGNLWALAGTWYAGPPEAFWGGFFVRAGAGPAIANYALAIPDPEDPTGGRELQARIDEWGWGVLLAVGYEVRVSRHFAAGVQVSSNYLWIEEGVQRVWYGGPVMQLLWYF